MSKRKPRNISGAPAAEAAPPFKLSEDWLAVIIAFVLIALAAAQILGEMGIPISY